MLAFAVAAGLAVYLRSGRDEVAKKTDTGDTPGLPVTPPVVPPIVPPETLKPTVALDAKDGTVIAVPGYEYLIDASKDGVRKWLDAHKAAKFSVVCLDAYQVGDRPRFVAVSALDGRQPDWAATLDSPGALNAAWNPVAFPESPTHTLVSLSGYEEARQLWSVLLWHRGAPSRAYPWIMSGNAELKLRGETKAVAQVRIHTTSGVPAGVPVCSSAVYSGEKFFSSLWKEATETEEFLEKHREQGMRPGVLSGCEYPLKKGVTAFGATVIADKGATASDYALGLAADELGAKARAMAKAGFTPASLTGYATKDGTRYCGVWVKYPPRAKESTASVALDAKDGTVIPVPGYEYLVDATRAGLDKWLKAHKDAGYSVVWLDAYQVGDKPKFAAVSALDSRQADWVELLDVRNDLMDVASLLQTLRNQGLKKDDHTLLAASTYTEGGVSYSALLCWKAPPGALLRRKVASIQIAGVMEKEIVTNRVTVRDVRPTLNNGELMWQFHFDRHTGDKGFPLGNANAKQVEDFLTEHCRAGMRPGSIVACEHAGMVVFGATVYADKNATASDYAMSLTADKLREKATAMAKAGFTPASLTGYATKDGTRFCAVWVKYPLPKLKPTVALDPKDGTVIPVGGWEYLVDATPRGVQLWLDAQKGKHSVMWLDSYFYCNRFLDWSSSLIILRS